MNNGKAKDIRTITLSCVDCFQPFTAEFWGQGENLQSRKKRGADGRWHCNPCQKRARNEARPSRSKLVDEELAAQERARQELHEPMPFGICAHCGVEDWLNGHSTCSDCVEERRLLNLHDAPTWESYD